MRNSLRAALFLLFFASAASAQEISPREWPRIAPLKKTFSFADMADPAVDLLIPGADGSPQYRLECRSGDTYEGKDFDYSGDFECRLQTASGADAHKTLLTYDPLPARDSESRARFFYSDLEGKCGDYPEFGRSRTFRLRGMRLRLSLAFSGHGGGSSNPGQVASAALRFSVEARPDPAALTQIAEDVPYEDPAVVEPAPGTRTCARVTPKHVPGVASLAFANQQRLGPPYPPVAAKEKTVEIPPRERGSKPQHLEPELVPSDDLEPWQLLSLALATPQGENAYEFECSEYGEGVGRWGLRCGLYPVEKRINLLAESVDPFTRKSRAQFLTWQLYGNCAAYSEWGAARHFRLRGMQITIELSEMVFSPRDKQPTIGEGVMKRARLHVRVEPDAAATAPVALPSRTLDWENAAGPGTCMQVLVNPRAEK